MKASCWMILVAKQRRCFSPWCEPWRERGFSFVGIALAVGIVGVCSLLIACSNTSSSYQLSGSTMGTTYSVTLVGRLDGVALADLKNGIETILEEMNRQMSTYRDDSEIIRFNQSPTHQWFPVSNDFFHVVQLGQTLSEQSSGFFDITLGPLIDLWGFGPNANFVSNSNNEVPDEQSIELAKSRVGWQYLQLNQQSMSLLKTRDLVLNVSAIAKGYAVDQLFQYLVDKGFKDLMVEIGGEIRMSGSNARQQAWRIGVEVPTQDLNRRPSQVLALSSGAVATSGDYRNYFEENGVRYSHTIDPHTGYPVRRAMASVTVVHDTAALADGYATALNAMGFEKASEFAQRLNLAVSFILYTNRDTQKKPKDHVETNLSSYIIHRTDAFQALL